MKRIAVAAIMAITLPAHADDSAPCAALVKSIDSALRGAALSQAQLLSAPPREAGTLRQDILAELAAINANITLMAMNHCAPLRDPVAIPGPYKGAASKCAIALVKASSSPPTGHATPECIISNWQRDPVQ